MNTTFQYDHYFLHDEITEAMQTLVGMHPAIMKLESLTKTAEGRDLWMATLTDPETGLPEEKPAMYLDGNHHAGEVTSSMVVLHFLDYLATNADNDPEVRELLRRYTFYILPRVSPDGAEVYLTTPLEMRSVNRPYPFDEPQPGLQLADVDGDGAIRFMRLKTPYGAWKVSPVDSRLMVRRRPHETEGEFYNVYREGTIKDYDGVHIQVAPSPWGLDFNRSFPMHWQAEGSQAGAGEYPLANPETKAVADFVLAHKNIGTACSFHTAGGYLVFPPGFDVSKDVLDDDMKMYRRRGELCQQITSYPAMNLLRDFWPKDGSHHSWGTFVDWCHYAQGIPAFTMECWDLNVRAGVPNAYPMHSFVGFKEDEKSERETKQVLDWIDENLGPDTFKPWTEVEHPQLGAVEIGGINHKFVSQNCPLTYLSQEVEKHTRFLLEDVKVLPRISADELQAESLGGGLYRVRAVVGNRGYLPNYLTKQGLKLGKNHPVKVSLDGAEIVSGVQTVEFEKLEGFSGVNTGHIGFIGGIVTLKHPPFQETAQWIVRGKAGDTLTLRCAGETTGRAVREITL